MSLAENNAVGQNRISDASNWKEFCTTVFSDMEHTSWDNKYSFGSGLSHIFDPPALKTQSVSMPLLEMNSEI